MMQRKSAPQPNNDKENTTSSTYPGSTTKAAIFSSSPFILLVSQCTMAFVGAYAALGMGCWFLGSVHECLRSGWEGSESDSHAIRHMVM